MTLVEDSNGQSLASPRGRRIVFTPERMDQIRNLVERGHGREEIAEIIGCTVGSLQVTCSREGISLRRLNGGNGGRPPLKRTPIVVSQPSPVPAPAPAPAPVPVLERPGIVKASPTFTLHIDYGNRMYDLPIEIDSNTLCDLACMATVNGVKIGDMIARAIVAGVREITS